MIFAMRKSTFYNSFTRQKPIISFSFLEFSELPSAILGKKNWKIASIQPCGATKTGDGDIPPPCMVFSAPKIPRIKDKNHFLPECYTQRHTFPRPPFFLMQKLLRQLQPKFNKFVTKMGGKWAKIGYAKVVSHCGYKVYPTV